MRPVTTTNGIVICGKGPYNSYSFAWIKILEQLLLYFLLFSYPSGVVGVFICSCVCVCVCV